jgi:SPP1 family predicted phage head-tail adaptor
MRSGPMRFLVVAEQPVGNPDGEGGEVVNWVPRMSFWARIEPISSREQMRANTPIAGLTARIVTRWTAAAAQVDATWRLRHGLVLYTVLGAPIDKDSRHQELEFMCGAGMNSG